MSIQISILTIGSEIVDGRILNSNSQYLARSLNEHDIFVKQMLTCDDNLQEIILALAYLYKFSDYIIVTGGLGPTADDLTRQAIADFFKLPLVLDQQVLDQIKDLFKIKKREFVELNKVQAYFPKTAKIIANPIGTAPGFIIELNNKTLVALPGVPKELYPMFETSILKDLIDQQTNKAKIHTIKLRFFGISESLIAEKINSLKLPEIIKIAYQVIFPEVKLLLKSDSLDLLDQTVDRIKTLIGEYLISEDDTSLIQVIHEKLLNSNLTLATAESCTGGLISSLLVANSGASRYFKGAAVVYANHIKQDLLNVPSEILKNYGAVSSECVDLMAKNLSKKFNTEIAIAISGVAGPTGGTIDKPVGTVWIAVKVFDKIMTKQLFLNYPRENFRIIAAFHALDLLRKELL